MNARTSRSSKAKASRTGKRDWLSFDRVDYLGTTIVLGIAAAGAVLVGLGGPVLAAATNAPLALSYTTQVTSAIALPRDTTHDGYATVELLLRNATTAERLGQALPGLIFAAMTIVVAWLLFQLLHSTQAREPFTRANVWRINMTALIVGIGGSLVQVAQAFADNAIHTSGRLPDSSATARVFELSFTPVPLLVMLVIALFGEVLRRGVELRDDVSGLV